VWIWGLMLFSCVAAEFNLAGLEVPGFLAEINSDALWEATPPPLPGAIRSLRILTN
jgi:hypothetical protein